MSRFIRFRKDIERLPFDWTESPDKVREMRDEIVLIVGGRRNVALVVKHWKVLPYQYIGKHRIWKHRDTWIGKDYRSKCGPCHLTGIDSNTLEFSELGIGCEACHRAGKRHCENPEKNHAYVPKGKEACKKCHFQKMNLPAASCRVSRLILFYPLTLTLSPGRGDMDLTPQQATGNYQVKIVASKHNHRGDAYGYRIEEGGKTLVYCTDVEYKDRIDPKVVALSRNADLLIHDAQYTPDELKVKKGWGHSSWEQAVEVAEQAGVKKLALFHHDPEHNDTFLSNMERECKKRFKRAFFAKEGDKVEL